MPNKIFSANKKVKIILLLLTGVVCLFGFLLYATTKTKSASLDKVPPFQQLIGKTVTLNQDVYLMQEKEVRNKNFPYVLMDAGHMYYQWYSDRMKADPAEVNLVGTVPAATKVTFKKATIYTNGVSGTSTACLFGTMMLAGIPYNIEYIWGEISAKKMMENEYNKWVFPLAPWQQQQDTGIYELPDATWW